ncbi:isoprenylcysteine carboxylmethyltransferase family protein [Mammaliicoccus stepanovicii]|uniref:Membrane spanning protein n=1 Tax=Mammaliicoccus stepanovicii TaxID=643214 RepID=A0A239Y788_9STAP|nr:isoprenylcysteine carboxylmethyltransferase family protein [Mammaliicoccus stepanovicii]PNZ71562.1 hypothetical protein CD111_12260 [Mammaliicoccus stepanovicii]GGI42989.1 membrane protein [Mammaliicoccus stepanovicii]SNV54253.1 membrane spanning protein [Mammaliicoccus stepanovicii]
MAFYLLLAFFIVRLLSLKISIRNSKLLKQKGAKEYGVVNSKWLAITHILIYLVAAVEVFINKSSFGIINLIGLLILIGSYLVLFHVIKVLGSIWTLKLFILPDHPIIKSGLYKITKHPNYFLNILPEILGVILLTKSIYAIFLIIPYAYFLYTRIKQEESLMDLK